LILTLYVRRNELVGYTEREFDQKMELKTLNYHVLTMWKFACPDTGYP
jgi:hypothetical protein